MKHETFSFAGVGGARFSVPFECLEEKHPAFLHQMPGVGTQRVLWGVAGGLVGSLLPCRKDDRLKEASLKTCVGKEWCWAATDRAVSSEIIPQTKLTGETAEEQGKDLEYHLSLLREGSPVALGQVRY